MEKFVENCKISQRFGVSRKIMDKIGVQLCEIYILPESKRHFNKLSFFLFPEKVLSSS